MKIIGKCYFFLDTIWQPSLVLEYKWLNILVLFGIFWRKKKWGSGTRVEGQKTRTMPDALSIFPLIHEDLFWSQTCSGFWKGLFACILNLLVLICFSHVYQNKWYSASLQSVELHRGKTDRRKLNLLKQTYHSTFVKVKLVSLIITCQSLTLYKVLAAGVYCPDRIISKFKFINCWLETMVYR